MTIHHRLLGNGEHRVVMLHDWFGSSTGWGPFLDHLDGSAFSYAFLDYRGYGERAEVPGEYTLAEIVEDVLALADQLDWPSFSLVGHSMGGKAAQLVLAEAPRRVRKLVGIAPVPAEPFPLEGDAYQLFHGAATQPANRRVILDMITGHRAGAVWLDAMTARSVALSRPEAFEAYLTQWSTQDFAAKIDGAELPVRVFACEYDEAITPELMRATWLPHYPQGELTVLPATGHYPMHETPVAFAAALEGFLR